MSLNRDKQWEGATWPENWLEVMEGHGWQHVIGAPDDGALIRLNPANQHMMFYIEFDTKHGSEVYADLYMGPTRCVRPATSIQADPEKELCFDPSDFMLFHQIGTYPHPVVCDLVVVGIGSCAVGDDL